METNTNQGATTMTTRVVPILSGTKPALRLRLDDGTHTVRALTLYPTDPLWPAYWWDPATGWYGMGKEARPGTVTIDRAQVAGVRSMEPAAAPKVPTVDRLERDGKRTLTVGQFVECQPKQRKGTGKAAGTISTIWADGTVEVAIGTATVHVGADWVQAKNRK